MIELPDFDRPFDYENGFYLSCDVTRIAKILAHYELYKMALEVPGAIVECGVLKGASLSRFAAFRELLSTPASKRIVAFDVFGPFPETGFEPDREFKSQFGDSQDEEMSISVEHLEKVLEHKGCDRNVELVPGNICETVPRYATDHPEFKISLLNLDTDIYEPSVTILEHFYPRIQQGGILILDDYGVWPGETQAVDEYFAEKPKRIQKLPFCMTPCYIIKE